MRAEHFEETCAGEPRQVRGHRQRQCQHRQHQIARRAVLPARHRQPAQVQSEHQREQRAGDEARQRERHGRERRDAVVGAAVAPQRRQDAGRNSGEHGQQNRRKAKGRGERQALGDELGHGKIALPERGPEIPAQQAAQVVCVLHRERLVESVEPFEVRPHGGRQRLLLRERPAGRQAHDTERDADDDEERGDSSGDAPECVAQHDRTLGRRRAIRQRYGTSRQHPNGPAAILQAL